MIEMNVMPSNRAKGAMPWLAAAGTMAVMDGKPRKTHWLVGGSRSLCAMTLVLWVAMYFRGSFSIEYDPHSHQPPCPAVDRSRLRGRCVVGRIRGRILFAGHYSATLPAVPK